MYINSPGGVVTAGMAIYDTMQFIKCPVATLCIGQAASMGSLLLCAGAPGMRFALPNARIMVHQPSGGFQGQASDIERHALDIIKIKRRLNEVYVKHTGQRYEKVENTLDRDHFMSAEESQAFGLVDRVLHPSARRSNRCSGPAPDLIPHKLNPSSRSSRDIGQQPSANQKVAASQASRGYLHPSHPCWSLMLPHAGSCWNATHKHRHPPRQAWQMPQDGRQKVPETANQGVLGEVSDGDIGDDISRWQPRTLQTTPA